MSIVWLSGTCILGKKAQTNYMYGRPPKKLLDSQIKTHKLTTASLCDDDDFPLFLWSTNFTFKLSARLENSFPIRFISDDVAATHSEILTPVVSANPGKHYMCKYIYDSWNKIIF